MSSKFINSSVLTIFTFLWLALLIFNSCTRPQPLPPNVIILLTDDQGYGDLGAHGHPYMHTPNMDELYQRSLRFTNFHVAPSCTATRSQLMTGIDALHNGAFRAHGQFHLLDRKYKLMPEYFSEKGYNTALYGKWHLGGNSIGYRPHERGFQDAVHFLRGGHWSHPNPWNADCMDDQYYHNGKIEQYQGFATDLWFDLGKEFVLKSKVEEKPFFLYLAVNPPHIPLLVPEKYRESYTGQGLDDISVNFFSMLGTVDQNLGSFLEFLKNEGVADNTIFIFMSDNGSANKVQEYNAGMRGRKTDVYEGGHRVPFFVYWPNGELPNGSDITEMIQVQDLLPTLAEICDLGASFPQETDGSSFAGLLNGASQPELSERKLVVQMRESKYTAAVMWRDWRLVNGKELYNLANDWGQQNDVAANYPNITSDLSQHYEGWWKITRAEPEPYFVGSNDEEVKLTAYDWYGGPRVYNWPHLRAGNKGNGRYKIVFERAGKYTISLRRWPKEANAGIRAAVPAFVPFDSFLGELPAGVALDIRKARIKLGSKTLEAAVADGDMEVQFTFDVVKGETTLQTWFIDGDEDKFGAYYVYMNYQL